MGLSRAAIRFLVREHRRRPFGPSLLTLGRQCVYARYAELQAVCREEGLSPRELPGEHVTNLLAWEGTPRAQNASDADLFHLLGVEHVQALDRSDFEGAELIWDLNVPVPEHLWSRFDTLLDSGTLEHVFDVRTALMNANRMLKPGGRIIHMGPCNNYANHGFYQFGPTLYWDYYTANGYADIRVFVAEETKAEYEDSGWELFEIDPRQQPLSMVSRRRLLVICHAEKRPGATVDRIPVQSYYRASEVADNGAQPAVSRLQRLKNLVPLPLRHLVRKHLLGQRRGKPWGSIRRGKLS